MKDIIITGRVIRREIIIVIVCLLVAELINLGAVIHYNRPASELVSMIGFVAFTAVIIYLILALLRAVAGLVCRIFRKH